MFSVPLARNGEGGYPNYRIPSLIVTPAGTLLAAYDGRPSPDDLPGPIDLLLRRSHDNGATWQPQEVVCTGTGLAGFGDPSLIVDTATGRILLFHVTGTLAGFFQAVEGFEPDYLVQHVHVSVSDDDGVTWQHRRITGQLKRPGVSGMFAASGTGVRIANGAYEGRLVQPMVLMEHGEITAAAAFSDDHGETWTLGDALGAGTDESAIAALPDGSLLMHCRAAGNRRSARSVDGGATWTTPQPIDALPDPSDNGSLIALAAVGAAGRPSATLVASSNLDPELRRNTALSLSLDGGLTWPHQLILCEGSSGYSCAAELPDGRIGVLYEKEGYTEIVFEVVSLDEIMQCGPADLQQAGIAPPSDPTLEVILDSVTPGPPVNWETIALHHADSVEIGDVDVDAWRAAFARYAAEGRVFLGTREAQARLYGAPLPGLRAGDVLAFNVRVRLPEGVSATGMVLEYPGGHTEPRDIEAGGRMVHMRARRIVTAADVAAGTVDARFAVPALGLSHEVCYSAATGQRRDPLPA